MARPVPSIRVWLRGLLLLVAAVYALAIVLILLPTVGLGSAGAELSPHTRYAAALGIGLLYLPITGLLVWALSRPRHTAWRQLWIILGHTWVLVSIYTWYLWVTEGL